MYAIRSYYEPGGNNNGIEAVNVAKDKGQFQFAAQFTTVLRFLQHGHQEVDVALVQAHQEGGVEIPGKIGFTHENAAEFGIADDEAKFRPA